MIKLKSFPGPTGPVGRPVLPTPPQAIRGTRKGWTIRNTDCDVQSEIGKKAVTPLV